MDPEVLEPEPRRDRERLKRVVASIPAILFTLAIAD